MSEDNLNKFIGANIVDIGITDTALNTLKFEEIRKNNMTYPNNKLFVMFVNISTNKGLLQFVAYNGHNGYYGHEAYVIAEQLMHQEEL